MLAPRWVYPRGMAGEPAEPLPPGQPSQSEERIDAPERSGPIAIARYVKDDGRALILYTRDEPPPA
jgi:hypothetical protein